MVIHISLMKLIYLAQLLNSVTFCDSLNRIHIYVCVRSAYSFAGFKAVESFWLTFLLASKCDYSYKVAGVALWPLPHATCHTQRCAIKIVCKKVATSRPYFFFVAPKNVRALQNAAAAAAAATSTAAVISATAASSYNFLGAIIALIAM